MAKRRLPIGIRTLRKIREGGCYYVDKTAHIRRLVDEGSYFFLSRPRSFGKSLFLDTVKELFECNRTLFEGLVIHDDWDWSVRHPVVRLSFGGATFPNESALASMVADQLEAIESEAAILTAPIGAPQRFRHVIRTLRERSGQRVVVLVDDFDRPVLDALSDPGVARANRDLVCGFGAVVKDCDADVRFTFFTGAGKFATGNLFSGLNNLIDITLDPRHSDVCGYTDADLDSTFTDELAGLDRGEIRRWYGGYRWRGEEEIYNPLGVLRLFRDRQFDGSWFDSAVPAFLIDALIERGADPATFDDTIGDRQTLSSFDLDAIAMETLLFQTGCVTITSTEDVGGSTFYRLGYPNPEVRRRLSARVLHGEAPDPV